MTALIKCRQETRLVVTTETKNRLTSFIILNQTSPGTDLIWKTREELFIQKGIKGSVAAAAIPGTIWPGFTASGDIEPKPRIKLSISSYSYWHFKEEKFPIEKVIDEAAKLGVEGIDILHMQMESEENKYIQELKRRAYLWHCFYLFSIHQGFVSPDKEVLKRKLKKQNNALSSLQKWVYPV